MNSNGSNTLAMAPKLPLDTRGTLSLAKDTSRSENAIADAQPSLDSIVHHIVPMETVSSKT